MEKELFEGFKKRLNSLDEAIREQAIFFGGKIYEKEQCSKEEALERGIAKAEIEKRKL